MHFCSDELAVILMVFDRHAEHLWRYVKGTFYYACHCARCFKQRMTR